MKTLNFRTVLLLVILALCSAFLVLWVIKVAQNINAPQIEYSEGFMLYLGRLFTTGHFSWTLSSTPPFNVAFYTPFGTYVLGIVNQIFGETLVAGRVLNLCYTVGCLSMVYLIVKQQTKDTLVSLIAAALPMCAVTMIAWSFFIRVDLLAIFLELAGVYVVLRTQNSYKVLWAIPLFLLAFYTKQSSVAGAAATCLYLITRKGQEQKEIGWSFVAVFGCLFLTSIAAFQILTNGEFIKEILLYQRTVPAFQYPMNIILTVVVSLTLYLPATFMAGIFIKDNFKHYLSIFALSALLFNSFTLAHPGGNINYLFETIFAVCILAGLWLANADIVDKSLNVIITAGIFILVLFVLGVTGLMGEAFPDKTYIQQYHQGVGIISDATYPILTENAGMVLDAKQVPYYEPFVFNNLAKLGYFDEKILLKDLDTHRIQYVVTQFMLPNVEMRRFSPAVQSAITENYHVVFKADTDANYSFVVWERN